MEKIGDFSNEVEIISLLAIFVGECLSKLPSLKGNEKQIKNKLLLRRLHKCNAMCSSNQHLRSLVHFVSNIKTTVAMGYKKTIPKWDRILYP